MTNIFDSQNNLIVLASKKNAVTSEDKIIMIDHNTKLSQNLLI